MNIDGWSRKRYFVLEAPTEEDNCPDQERILRSLETEFGQVEMDLSVLRKLYPLCQEADWRVTAGLAWDGERWRLVSLEKGNTAERHYGVCADLGSTTLALQVVHMDTGRVMAQVSGFNRQIAYGEDILTRIFYCKENPERLKELRRETVESFLELFQRAEELSGISVARDCISMTVSGNTTMIHFLYGLDPFPVFAAPYAVRALAPGIYRAGELGFPMAGCVYSYPAKANYLGGDIISGMVATGIPFQEELSVFLDIGTNGELVIGNKDFLIAGAGAAGPALEGGVVKTGMRAEPGAVDTLQLLDGEFKVHVLGEGEPKGICGSGIVELLAQLYLEGWLDMRGKLQEGKSPLICRDRQGELAVKYAPGLLFYQRDVDEFLKTKAAANTMVEYLMGRLGLSFADITGGFYAAGAFGTHISKEAGVTVGLYPDLPREKLILPGNTSLDGAREMLLHRELLERVKEILEKMEYVQFGAVEDFLQIMVAGTAIPHTDYRRYPSVMAELARRGRPLDS